jgi:hypothetical protein
MRFNAIIRAKSYQPLTTTGKILLIEFFSIVKYYNFFNNPVFTGVAWLSKARAVRCLVYSFNERDSSAILVFFY